MTSMSLPLAVLLAVWPNKTVEEACEVFLLSDMIAVA